MVPYEGSARWVQECIVHWELRDLLDRKRIEYGREEERDKPRQGACHKTPIASPPRAGLSNSRDPIF
ncbi:hypothetical protein GE061_015065 [Apolygus lucorum]|uniref:Uncharacterized protein n=1 Tax=Apolygus lucorum TaxID=248454 RepID=A0A8S9XM40_APOLU|nr:hypothetical protein GE061_015065 [Apolygus lucorum]